MRYIVAAGLFCLVLASPAQAIVVCNQLGCSDRPGVEGTSSQAYSARRSEPRAGRRGRVVRFLPNPPGCPRVRVSCACRLAARWNLRQKFGPRLDKVTEWLAVFRRTHSPGPRVAAIKLRKGAVDHIMGIVGGGPGAWEVEDYNSGGHRNRLRIVSSLRGYILVDTRDRVAQK